ncbi:hypothetical protein ACFLUX_01005 [Chloroflexota bacterium]
MMTKTRLSWILAGLAALVAVALILFLPNTSDLKVGKAQVEQRPEDQAISVNTKAERFGVQKGDAFLYIVEVLYDPDQVSEIDSASLDDQVNLEPFEIRDVKETEYDLDSRTRMYQRQYEIQLISGEVEHLYEFPTIVVRYKLKEMDGFSEIGVIPEPIYVTNRLPADVSNLIGNLEIGFGPLKPLKGEIENVVSKNRLPWILLALGGFLAAATVADLTLRVIPQRKEKEKQDRKMEMGNILYQAYRSLHENVAVGAKPKSLLAQMDHILGVVLAQKENVGWLGESNLDLVSSEIKTQVISLFDKCQKAYGTEDIKQEEVEEALRQLEEILEFYFAEEMEVWKSWPSS